MRDISSLVRQAASQHGLLTSQQIRDLGYSQSVQARLVRVGVLATVRRGVVALAGARPTWEQQMLAVCLSSGGRAYASHRSALRLWGLWSRFEGIEVAVGYPANLRTASAVVHRPRVLDSVDCATVDGIPTTTAARALVDVAKVVPAKTLENLIDHAESVGLVAREDIEEVRTRVGARGRDGIALVDEVTARVHVTGAESGPEAQLARLLIQAGLPAPTPQHPVVWQGRRYRVDLAYPDAKLALEYDGRDVHTRVDRFESDRRRQNDVIEAGWTILRFTAVDLRDRSIDVIARVRRLLHRPRAEIGPEATA